MNKRWTTLGGLATTLVWLMLLLVGCAQESHWPPDPSALPVATDLEPFVSESMEGAWESAGLPSGNFCQPPRIATLPLSDAGKRFFRDESGGHHSCAHEHVVGCYRAFTRFYGAKADVPVTYRMADQDGLNAAEHEYLHVLSRCTGLHDDADYAHHDPAVWSLLGHP